MDESGVMNFKSKQMSDEVKELVALKSGSERAFESIYNRYSGKLYNFIMTISQGDSYLAEEMVQSAFIKLWEIREQIDPEKSILSFLSTIAKNMLLNSYKRKTVEFLYQEFITHESDHHENNVEKEINRKWLEGFVDELIEQLPPSRRQIFILRRKKELSTREIAEQMNISVSTVETQLSLATKYMREMFEKNWDKLFVLAMASILI